MIFHFRVHCLFCCNRRLCDSCKTGHFVDCWFCFSCLVLRNQDSQFCFSYWDISSVQYGQSLVTGLGHIFNTKNKLHHLGSYVSCIYTAVHCSSITNHINVLLWSVNSVWHTYIKSNIRRICNNIHNKWKSKDLYESILFSTRALFCCCWKVLFFFSFVRQALPDQFPVPQAVWFMLCPQIHFP